MKKQLLPLAIMAAMASAAQADIATIERVSVSDTGAQTAAHAWSPSVSADGRYVAFSADADDLVTNDTNGVPDILVLDRATGTRELLIAAGVDGLPLNGGSFRPQLSADGRYVSFASRASNLVPGDTNDYDIFVHDRQTQTTELVSVSSQGEQADQASILQDLSADGRFVVFTSSATNLVEAATGAYQNVYLHDRVTKTTELVSGGLDGTAADDYSYYPQVSADGRFVAYQSKATNLVVGDTNQEIDIFVFDRVTRTTERVNISNEGDEANNESGMPFISGDGRHVAFTSWATNLTPDGIVSATQAAFIFDRETRTVEKAWFTDSQGLPLHDAVGFVDAISHDGRYLSVQGLASWPADANTIIDILVYDRETKTSERVSRNLAGDSANGNSRESVLSADGSHVAFMSQASNLVPNDTNEVADIFVVTREPGGVAPGDYDGDQMPDSWEDQQGFDSRHASDASGDADGDSLTNLREFQLGTNARSTDSDSDGLPDGWEVQYGLNPTGGADASQDKDGDDFSNLEEYEAGTNPNDRNSKPRLSFWEWLRRLFGG